MLEERAHRLDAVRHKPRVVPQRVELIAQQRPARRVILVSQHAKRRRIVVVPLRLERRGTTDYLVRLRKSAAPAGRRIG
ncbi:hypothetical protein WL30_00275 [Burkholderia ubonensis]|nr:hypothetical protein WL30_00275 [Burkholderia ubonensis]KWB28119.1 hypothetical protein WL31_30215 [Burkholderia ubonensis]